jgi:rhamnosyltransferase
MSRSQENLPHSHFVIVKDRDYLYDMQHYPMNLTANNLTDKQPSKIVAVVVTYNPLIEQLKDLLDAVGPQVEHIIIVDNASSAQTIEGVEVLLSYQPAELCLLPENRGVGAAQNIGIAYAKNWGADFVLLFDQDSVPASDMVAKLLNAYFTKVSLGDLVAVVGPWYEDPRRHGVSAPFVELRSFGLVRIKRGDQDTISPVNHLISSGSLFPIAVFDVVGLMRDDFFIDCIDTEWCERANYLGYKSYGVAAAFMQHSLGDEPMIIYGNKQHCFHSPFRLYYQFRNAIWQYRLPYPGFKEKIGNAARLYYSFVFYLLFAKPRWQYFQMISRGVWDGLSGRLGKLGR